MAKNKGKPLSELWSSARALAKPSLSFSTPRPSYLVEARAFAAQGRIVKTMALVAEHPDLLSANIAERSSAAYNQTLLDLAFSLGHQALACDLIEAGAWLAPAQAPHSAAANEPPFEIALQQIFRQAALRSYDSIALERADSALEASGRPRPSWSQWLTLVLSLSRLNLAAEICDRFGLAPSESDLASFSERAPSQKKHPFFIAAFRPSDSEADAAWHLLELAKDHFSDELTCQLWRSALELDDLERADALASWGRVPFGWTLPAPQPPSSYYPNAERDPAILDTGSLLAEAAARGASRCFSILRNIPEAVAAAKSYAPHPKALEMCPIQEIAALARLGVDISRTDENGRNVLHHWADADKDQARDGWLTLCKLRPSLLSAADWNGQTPAQAQRRSLWQRKRLAAFEVLLSRIERADISKDLPTQLCSASPSKPRL